MHIVHADIITKRAAFFKERLKPDQFKRMSDRYRSFLPRRTYRRKVWELQEEGFDSPEILIATCEHLLTVPMKRVRANLAWLRARGFTDPYKMAHLAPAILYKQPANMEKNVSLLVHSGVNTPLRVIESYPTVLTYSSENIKRKISFARKLGADISAFVQYNKYFIGMSIKRYIALLRDCRLKDLEPNPGNIERLYRGQRKKTKAGLH